MMNSEQLRKLVADRLFIEDKGNLPISIHRTGITFDIKDMYYCEACNEFHLSLEQRTE